MHRSSWGMYIRRLRINGHTVQVEDAVREQTALNSGIILQAALWIMSPEKGRNVKRRLFDSENH